MTVAHRTNLTAPWQPAHTDRVVSDMPPDFIGKSSWWTRIFPLLVTSQQVILGH